MAKKDLIKATENKVEEVNEEVNEENNLDPKELIEVNEEVNEVKNSKVMVMFNINVKYKNEIFNIGDVYNIDEEEAIEFENKKIVSILSSK